MGCCPSSIAWYLLLRIADRHGARPTSTRLTPSRRHPPEPGGNATHGWSTQSYRPPGRTIVDQGITTGIVLPGTGWATSRLCQRLQRYPQTSGSLGGGSKLHHRSSGGMGQRAGFREMAISLPGGGSIPPQLHKRIQPDRDLTILFCLCSKTSEVRSPTTPSILEMRSNTK